MSTDLIVGMTPEQVDRYLEILHEKNRLSAEWLEVEKAKRGASEPRRDTQRGGDKDESQPKRERAAPSPENLGLTAEQMKLLHTEDGGQTYAPISYLGDVWRLYMAAFREAGYGWVSKGKDSYWERQE